MPSDEATCCGRLAALEANAPPAIPVLGVASIFHAGYLLRCVRSVDFAVDTLVVVHNGNDGEVGAAIVQLQQERPAMRVVREPVNTGCAGGWNRIIAANRSAPWWLIVNDDIAFPPGALRNIAARVWSRVQTRTAEGHYKFWYQHGATGWSCFALTARAVERVGTFDENIYPVYFEDQDYEWRLERAGLASVHVRDVLVVHGAEDAEAYQSGSMTALHNATGGEALRKSFTSWLTRGANRHYMRQKWGALKPSRPDDPDMRWHSPFNLPSLPLSWWTLDAARRQCTLAGDATGGQAQPGDEPCPFNAKLAHDAATRERAGHGSRTTSFASRLSGAAGAAAKLKEKSEL